MNDENAMAQIRMWAFSQTDKDENLENRLCDAEMLVDWVFGRLDFEKESAGVMGH